MGQFSDKMYENGLPPIFINALLLATDSSESIWNVYDAMKQLLYFFL